MNTVEKGQVRYLRHDPTTFLRIETDPEGARSVRVKFLTYEREETYEVGKLETGTRPAWLQRGMELVQRAGVLTLDLLTVQSIERGNREPLRAHISSRITGKTGARRMSVLAREWEERGSLEAVSHEPPL